MKLRAAIYDPYLDTLGGGERYCLTIAHILIKNGYQTDIFWSGDRQILSKASTRFGLNLDHINIVDDIFSEKLHQIDMIDDRRSLLHTSFPPAATSNNVFLKIVKFFRKFKITRQYDLIFFLSDGSLPFLFGRKNFIHIQVPFVNNSLRHQKYFNYFKNIFIKGIICNSEFTQKFTQINYHQPCPILYPPIDTTKFNSNLPKKNIILSVGRFDNILNYKKQDILIDAFILLIKKYHLTNWKLILTGGSLESLDKNKYLQFLINKSHGYPIEIIPNPDFKDLQNLYSQSKIFWHAAGFGINENKHPEHTEHFGITTVEAQSSGLVPLVVAKGGLKEIITEGVNGYLWNDIEELTSKTNLLITQPQLLKKLSVQGLINSQKYSQENFETQFLRLIKT